MNVACTGRPILALGAAVAQELYGGGPPVMVLDEEAYAQIRDGEQLDLTDIRTRGVSGE